MDCEKTCNFLHVGHFGFLLGLCTSNAELPTSPNPLEIIASAGSIIEFCFHKNTCFVPTVIASSVGPSGQMMLFAGHVCNTYHVWSVN